MNNETVSQFNTILKHIKTNEKDKELKKKKRILQDLLLKELIKQNLPYVQVGTDLYLIKKIRKIQPKLDEEFLVKCYALFIKTQKQHHTNPLAFAKFVSHCQKFHTTTKITGQLSSKLPDDTFQFQDVPMAQ